MCGFNANSIPVPKRLIEMPFLFFSLKNNGFINLKEFLLTVDPFSLYY